MYISHNSVADVLPRLLQGVLVVLYSTYLLHRLGIETNFQLVLLSRLVVVKVIRNLCEHHMHLYGVLLANGVANHKAGDTGALMTINRFRLFFFERSVGCWLVIP